MRKRYLVGTALLAILLAVYFATLNRSPESAPPKQPDPGARFARITDLHQRKCLCEMASRPHSEISTALAQEVAGLETQDFATASAPLSGSGTCYPSLGDNACVSRIELVGASNQFVCSESQAQVLEAVWSDAFETQRSSSGRTDTQSADAALIRRLDDMRGELRASLPESTCRLP